MGLNCNKQYEMYDGKYDNLLYFYVFNYQLIQAEYTTGEKKEKEFPKIESYIKKKWIRI